MLWTRVQGKYGEGRCRQGGGVRTGNEGWLARRPRESRPVGAGRLIRDQPARLWAGQNICFLTSRSPHAWNSVATSIPTPVLAASSPSRQERGVLQFT